jgi:predicted nucleic acid-binding protein
VIVVDASVWVGRFVSRDAHHTASAIWLAQYLTTGSLLIGPSLLPVEVAGAVSRITGSAEFAIRSVELLLRLPSLRLVPVGGALTMDAARFAANLGLRGADAVYVSVAYRLAIPLLTWDEDQRIRGSGAVTCHTPLTIAPDARSHQATDVYW